MSTKMSEIHSTISTLSKKFEATLTRGLAVEIAEFYAEDAILLPAGSDFVRGKNDIKEFWQMALDMGVANIKLKILEVEQHDDTVIEMSTYTLSGSDGQVIDQGKGIVIWKHENTTWKLHRDIWNSNTSQ